MYKSDPEPSQTPLQERRSKDRDFPFRKGGVVMGVPFCKREVYLLTKNFYMI